MNIPIDVVVELLMENIPNKWMWTLHGRTIEAKKGEDLSDAIREYLLTLVPKPVLLSECEEYKGSSVNEPIMVYRVGKCAYRSEDNRWYGYADMCQVIQPVEVPHEAD